MDTLAAMIRRHGWVCMTPTAERQGSRYLVFCLPGRSRWVQIVLGSDGRLYVGTSRRMICRGGA